MPSAKPSRLVVVANRLPVRRSAGRWVESEGGLVTALLPIVKQGSGAWIGWTGSTEPGPGRFKSEGITLQSVDLTEREVDGFYNEFSNRTLWPLYHDAIRTPEFDRRHWAPYVDVNWKYARAAARIARPGDTVWVHDYHLQLVPRMLRELRPGLRIGFFLHIPFPPEELFAWLPWRTQILEGLLGSDLIGFQTSQAAKNFSHLARMFTEAEGTDTRLNFEGREVFVNAFPISIDTRWFEEAAASEKNIREARAIKGRVGRRRKILLAVDRLDYTKGIDSRLLAFQHLLKHSKLSVEDVCLMQIAVPSREKVFEYGNLRDEIERLVGSINGDHSIPGQVAVHYFRRSFTRDELAAYYMAADVMVVTPLRDGMNLVCKEYVACRRDSTGVLILSEFAGAASELRRAMLVNPRDIEGVAEAMEDAVRMPENDVKHRMGILRSQVRRHDVYDWARMFLEALQE